MNENEIVDALSPYNTFGGCFAFDELPKKIRPPTGIVVNTGIREEGGEHWIAIYIDGNRVGELFDSLASPSTLSQFEEFMSRNCNEYWFNGFPIQSSSSKLCGVWCISYLAMRFKGMKLWGFGNIFRGIGNPVFNDIFLAGALKSINK